MMDDPEPYNLEWLAIPRFALLPADGHWNKFECIRSGAVSYNGEIIDFPIGWTTDVTSSPPWGRSFLSQLGPHAPAALLHDRLLDLNYVRAYARKAMVYQLRLLELVVPWRLQLMAAGVWVGGQWRKIKPQ